MPEGDSMNITASMRKSLLIIAETPGIRPEVFARQYFDNDHPGWRRHTRCGNGTRQGGGLVLWAGGQIGKLRRAGFVTDRTALTKAGRDALQMGGRPAPGQYQPL